MSIDELTWRRGIVFGAALLYWAGVLVQARRIRRRIGKSPNLRPRNLKEKILLVAWLLVIGSWLVQPLLAGRHDMPACLQMNPALVTSDGFIIGAVMTLLGYAGTLWCYVIMGNTWRIGVNPAEKTTLVSQGPYRVVRHPIYLFQIIMLAGGVVLLPTAVSLSTLIFHYFCIVAKARDEEAYLLTTHGKEYGDYLARTGRFFPKVAESRREG